ncbi:LysR family transcriptional regulator (plasmid) [Rhizobium sp. T1470]|uniref:LysR family transcriptional regulator n=1 Tax=unclassified Rhizobium TaxID=2613769 RepID=UPI001AB00C30|nr:LysR family transcriptional regulator [Rhizobium sp. T1473]MCA0805585.1 LysR family transcriptional regulator [Rhizobium sp. T1473]
MEWSDIKIFLAVARASTLGGAARSLRLSHPTIGRRLRSLEEATGQTLFQRSADGFVLTDEGAAVLSLAEQMEESALTMERRLAGKEGKLEGLLRISSADWFGGYVLPPVVAAYRAAYPDVLVELLTGTRLFSLSHREADLVFRIVPFAEPDIVQRRLVTMRYGVYMRRDRVDPVIGDGSGFQLITMDASLGSFPDTAWLVDRFPNASVRLRSNSRHVQAHLCEEGLGLAVLPRPVGDRLAGLRRLELPDDPPEREIWMGYHRDLRRLGRLRAFVDMVVSILAR